MKLFLQFLSIFFIFVSSAFTQGVSQLVFSVTDNQGKAVHDLTKDDISLTIGKSQVKIDNIQNISNDPLEVVLLIDTTPSQEKVLPLSKKIALTFIDQILNSKKDFISIATFANVTVKFNSSTNDFTKAKKDIDALIPSKGNSYILDNLSFINKNGFSQSKDKKKIIILLSDGIDNSSQIEPKTLLAELVKNRVRLYTLHIKDTNFTQATAFNSMILGNFNQNGIAAISKNSGGKSFFAIEISKDEKILKILNEIKESLLGYYLIQFSIGKIGNNQNKFEPVNIKSSEAKNKKGSINFFYQREFYIENQ